MNPIICIRTIKGVSTFSFICPVLWYFLVAFYQVEVYKIPNLCVITGIFFVLIHAIFMWMLSKTLQSCAGASTFYTIILSTLIFIPMIGPITMVLLLSVKPEFVVTTYILIAFGVWLTKWMLRKCMVWTPHRCSFCFTILNDAVKSVI